jgi:enediyne biosynthesis protein E4
MAHRPLLAILLLLAACTGDKGDSPGTGDGGGDSGPPDTTVADPVPGPEFDRYCGDRAWDEELTEGTVQSVTGLYAGSFVSYREEGAIETTKLVPPHPFHVTGIKAAFADVAGTAHLRLMPAWGRSYPQGYPDDLDADENNLTAIIEMEVGADDTHNDYIEVDLSDRGIFLEPTQHYILAHEYLSDDEPPLAIGYLSGDESSRALFFVPGEDTPYGIDGNFRLMLTGEFFCEWDDDSRWFGDSTASQPFAETVSGTATAADIDGDGHQDLVTYGAGPELWKGDGAGGFAAVDGTFAAVASSGMLVFGDLDNDGDQDAFAAVYTTADSDFDGTTVMEGDCNDTDNSIGPGETETTNLRDDDCDGVADDGTDTSDSDKDGISVADGDCDDTLSTVAPGLAELRDNVDNDCDLMVDEDFASRVLLNDGKGGFTLLEGAGVEVTEPTTAAAFGDGNEDGNLDLYFGNWLELYPYDAAVQDRYYEGVGDGSFDDALEEAGLKLDEPWSVYGVEWTDTNNDGHQDIFVGNYHLYDNQLWQNQGDGTFEDVAPDVGLDHDEIPTEYSGYPGGHTYGADFGDADGDGDLDAYICNLSHPRTQPWADPSMFAVNQGAPDYSFVNQRELSGFIYDEGDVNAQWADYDNDGDLDLAVASLYSQHFSRLYRNDGDLQFTDVTYETGTAVELAVSALWIDSDEDGDEDLVIGSGARAPYVNLFENRVGQDNHWVNLLLEGTSTNRDGIGARVTLTAGGATQLRDMQGGGGLGNIQRPKVIHFGLGSTTTIDSLTVRWVGGATETFTGVGADGWWRLVEGSGVAVARWFGCQDSTLDRSDGGGVARQVL